MLKTLLAVFAITSLITATVGVASLATGVPAMSTAAASTMAVGGGAGVLLSKCIIDSSNQVQSKSK